MPKLIDLTGQVFSRLTVISRVEANGQARWFCACVCGKTTVVPGYEVRKGIVRSCGCLVKDTSALLNLKHGKTKSAEFRAWQNMKNRCLNPNVACYERYGALGITVCERWMHSFENFLSDVGERPEGCTLDRIDGNKGYAPDNCRWANLKTQANNKKRVMQIDFNGRSMNVSDWCIELGLSYRTIRARIYEHNWDPIKALTTPIKS